MPLPPPPLALARPHSTTHHGITIEDQWAWLRDPGYPKVEDPLILGHLAAENAYFEAAMAPHAGLVDTLFEEMKGRLKQDEASVPTKDGDWLSWWAFKPGEQYRRWYRRAVTGGPDELILDEPALAEGKDYFRLGALVQSPDGRLLAYAIDDNGSERFMLRIRDLTTGVDLPDTITGTLGGVVWSADSAALIYGLVNENWRIDVAKLHRIGTPIESDVELYRETDEGFQVGIGRTQSRRFLVIATGDHVTSEVRLLPAADPLAEPILVAPRLAGREYEVEEHEGTLFIRTNDTHPNFRIATADIAAPGDWREEIAASADFYIRGLTTFASFFTVSGREDGLDQILLHPYGGAGARIPFPEASYVAGLGGNPEYDVATLRLSYQSMVTPPTVFDYDVATRSFETLKVQEIPSGYDASAYATERLKIPARDGTLVPVSVVYRKDFAKDGAGPLHLYGYGAYGYAVPPGFSTVRLSLLDRGFAYAIAHIRGGDDLGHQWYRDGTLAKRTNTFNDFVDVARGLVDAGFAQPGRISTSGGSAGGELMGAVMNSDPDLWGAVVAHVPFVDVLNTMLDDSLPLTPGEWPEWGNPIEDKAAFELIASYSPYDNVTAQAYPPTLITAGLNDPRVTYWEPAKWAARLRATKTDANLLLLKTNMGAGHGGKSGRFEHLREDAEEQAFILWQLGLAP
jgi:oligopeptidase B